MTTHKTTQKFVICLQSDDPDLLTPRMIYEVLPDESASAANLLRVIDNEGEDYLYPASYFAPVTVASTTARTLRQMAPPATEPIRYATRSGARHISEK